MIFEVFEKCQKQIIFADTENLNLFQLTNLLKNIVSIRDRYVPEYTIQFKWKDTYSLKSSQIYFDRLVIQQIIELGELSKIIEQYEAVDLAANIIALKKHSNFKVFKRLTVMELCPVDHGYIGIFTTDRNHWFYSKYPISDFHMKFPIYQLFLILQKKGIVSLDKNILNDALESIIIFLLRSKRRDDIPLQLNYILKGLEERDKRWKKLKNREFYRGVHKGYTLANTLYSCYSTFTIVTSDKRTYIPGDVIRMIDMLLEDCIRTLRETDSDRLCYHEFIPQDHLERLCETLLSYFPFHAPNGKTYVSSFAYYADADVWFQEIQKTIPEMNALIKESNHS